jgi:hypothetical protein
MHKFNIEFESEETQDVADPALEGEKDQDVAAPESADESEKEVEVAEQPKPKAFDEEGTHSAFAAMRRRVESELRDKYETEMREAKAKAERAERLAKSRGFESYEAFERAGYEEQLANGVTADALQPLIETVVYDQVNKHPVVLEAQRLKAEAEAAALDRELREFAAEFPDTNVKTIDDVSTLPNFEQIYAHVQRGLRLKDAYILANYQTLADKKAAAARQSALTNATGKQHLQKTAGGDGDVEEIALPDDVYQNYKLMLPGWTRKQIHEHYKKSLKE